MEPHQLTTSHVMSITFTAAKLRFPKPKVISKNPDLDQYWNVSGWTSNIPSGRHALPWILSFLTKSEYRKKRHAVITVINVHPTRCCQRDRKSPLALTWPSRHAFATREKQVVLVIRGAAVSKNNRRVSFPPQQKGKTPQPHQTVDVHM